MRNQSRPLARASRVIWRRTVAACAANPPIGASTKLARRRFTRRSASSEGSHRPAANDATAEAPKMAAASGESMR
jgi:hypothetical protein